MRVAFHSCRHCRSPSTSPSTLTSSSKRWVSRPSEATPFVTDLRGAYRTRAHSNDELILGLKRYGVLTSARVEAALRSVDRGQYVLSGSEEGAYFDEPQPIGARQTISAPHMHVAALQQLEHVLLEEGATVLDVGSGSAYLSACFAALIGPRGRVVALERLASLVSLGQSNLVRANPELVARITFVQGDGWLGYPKCAPYDAIHVGAAATSVPEALIRQLRVGGRLLIPVGSDVGSQRLLEIDKLSAEGDTKERVLAHVQRGGDLTSARLREISAMVNFEGCGDLASL